MSTIEPRTATVTVYPGDYLDRIRHLERQALAAQEAESRQPRTLAETPKYLAIAEEHDALVKEAEAQAIHIKVRALPRSVWKALVKAHPPRVAGDDVSEQIAASDAQLGANEETFKDALVIGGIIEVNGEPVTYRSIVEPELSAEDLDNLSDADFDRVYFAAFGLNRGMSKDPKASLVSRLTQLNDETSS